MRLITAAAFTVILTFMLFADQGNSALQVSPTTTVVGSPISVTLTGTFGGGGFLSLTINFGDGSPPVTSNYPTAGTHSLSASHAYSQAGNFTITGTTTIAILAAGPTTSSETRKVAITNGTGTVIPGTGSAPITGGGPPTDLPRGAAGEEYTYRLDAGSGNGPGSCRLTRGKLPPGLVLEKNCTITGLPVQRGKFGFVIQLSPARGVPYNQEFTLAIDPGTLKIKVSPPAIKATTGEGGSENVTFSVTQPTVPIQDIIQSSRGEFLVNGRVVGSRNVPMSINLHAARPAESEMVKIPADVLRSARSAGTNRIVYRRVFSSQNFKPGSGDAQIQLRTPASGELRFTMLRLFFEQNNRPIILVKRNERDLTGVIEIHYDGSGTLKGYWQVDGRLIERVQKNVYYGKVLTLKTPQVPPLPTYSEGAHRLQFIITEPAAARQRVDFPEAIYHVEAKRGLLVVPITFDSPVSGAGLSKAGADFSWTEVPGAERYAVEFMKSGEEEPFFTAFTKQGNYQLQERVIGLKFTVGINYTWKVKAFNSTGELTGESAEGHFSMIE